MTGSLGHRPADTKIRPVAETVACAWCGGTARPSGRRLVACATCGVAQTHPPPDDAELAAAYATHYRPAGGRFAGGGDRVLRFSRGLLARRIDRLAPPGPVLDVGAGPGDLLDALHARGREAVGLERSLAPGRADIRTQELTQFTERRGRWAAVVFWHSLEHLRDAAQALDHACELLCDGGLLIVAVPNRASWQARALGDRWLALDLPRHLIHLTAEALVRRLTARGMTVERCSGWRGGQVVFGWLDGLVALLPGAPDLYAAIRRPQARAVPITAGGRAATLAAAGALLPVAWALSAGEILAGASGTVMVQARR